LWSLHCFNLFCNGQSNWLIAPKLKKKNWTCEAPPTNYYETK
jgi:hypothetical protein